MRVRLAAYKVGDWVYYFNPRKFKGRQDKWARKYTGPFCVTKVPSPVNVQLQKNKRSSPFIVHIDKVKPYLGEPAVEWVCKEVIDTATTEEPSNTYNRDPIMATTHSVEAENSQVWNNVDVITSNIDQEFRRNRPRRQIRLLERFRD